MGYQGVIFDLDGVICFTDEFHYLAWKQIAHEIGVYFDREINNRLRGVSRMDSLEIILEKHHGVPLSLEEKTDLASRKNEIYRRLLGNMTPADLPEEVKTTLEALREKGLKLAIGSSSKNAPFILERIGLAGYFDAVADGNCISHSKPHPEVFLKAAEFMHLSPGECLVVEDAVAGAQAGHAGGFPVACVGDAAQEGAGDFNLRRIGELLRIT